MKNNKTMMMKLTIKTLALVILLTMLGCQSTPTGKTKPESSGVGKVADTRLIQLAWMAGNWIDEVGNDISEERWTPSAGGTMFGINRTIIDGETVNFEYMRIQITKKGIVYFASPRGRYPPTPFGLSKVGKNSAVFYNGDKESPLRVSYFREGNTLHGRIEGTIDGETQSSEWVWKLSQQ